MRAAPTWAALALSLALVACGDDSTAGDPLAAQPLPPSHRTGELGAQRAREQTTPARGKVVPSDDPETRRAAAGGGGGAGPGRFPERHGRRVMDEHEAEASAKAIAQARMEGDTPCEQAFDALDHFRADFQDSTPWVPARRPDRGRFMDSCLALPRPLQQCMVPSYLRAHEDECEQVRTRWPAMTGRHAAAAGGGDDGADGQGGQGGQDEDDTPDEDDAPAEGDAPEEGSGPEEL